MWSRLQWSPTRKTTSSPSLLNKLNTNESRARRQSITNTSTWTVKCEADWIIAAAARNSTTTFMTSSTTSDTSRSMTGRVFMIRNGASEKNWSGALSSHSSVLETMMMTLWRMMSSRSEAQAPSDPRSSFWETRRTSCAADRKTWKIWRKLWFQTKRAKTTTPQATQVKHRSRRSVWSLLGKFGWSQEIGLNASASRSRGTSLGSSLSCVKSRWRLIGSRAGLAALVGQKIQLRCSDLLTT